MNLVKDVIIIKIEGANDKIVIRTNICMLVAVLSAPCPKFNSSDGIITSSSACTTAPDKHKQNTEIIIIRKKNRL